MRAPLRAPLLASLLALAVLLPPLAAPARAAAFDDLKADLASCLRFELEGAQRPMPMSSRAGFALRRCGYEMERLDRADGRRLRGDHGLSPSTRSVLDGVFGSGGRGRPPNRTR